MRDLLGTGDVESLALFQRANELGRRKQRNRCSGVHTANFRIISPRDFRAPGVKGIYPDVVEKSGSYLREADTRGRSSNLTPTTAAK